MTKQNKRRFGKTTMARNEFFEKGMEGEAIVYATLEGNFLSPEAAKRAIAQAKKEEREKIKEKMKFDTDTCGLCCNNEDILNALKE